MKLNAEKEMIRMADIFDELKIIEKPKADDFYSFAKNYFEDGQYFFEKEKYIESFEAFIISWAYIDAGLKLGFFKIPEKMKKHFTVD